MKIVPALSETERPSARRTTSGKTTAFEEWGGPSGSVAATRTHTESDLC